MEIRYERNDIAFERNMFRVRGDTVEIEEPTTPSRRSSRAQVAERRRRSISSLVEASLAI